jgi:hypothetical protein
MEATVAPPEPAVSIREQSRCANVGYFSQVRSIPKHVVPGFLFIVFLARAWFSVLAFVAGENLPFLWHYKKYFSSLLCSTVARYRQSFSSFFASVFSGPRQGLSFGSTIVARSNARFFLYSATAVLSRARIFRLLRSPGNRFHVIDSARQHRLKETIH